MELHVDDDGFVRAPAGHVYRRLTDIGRWPEWWSGARTAAIAAPDGVERHSIELRGIRPWRAVRLVAHAHDWRHDQGFALELSGDIVGRAEFWLEPGWGGTVVHHYVVAVTASPRPLAVLRDYRAALRRGLWGFKDAVQSEIRIDAGLRP